MKSFKRKFVKKLPVKLSGRNAAIKNEGQNSIELIGQIDQVTLFTEGKRQFLEVKIGSHKHYTDSVSGEVIKETITYHKVRLYDNVLKRFLPKIDKSTDIRPGYKKGKWAIVQGSILSNGEIVAESIGEVNCADTLNDHINSVALVGRVKNTKFHGNQCQPYCIEVDILTDTSSGKILHTVYVPGVHSYLFSKREEKNNSEAIITKGDYIVINGEQRDCEIGDNYSIAIVVEHIYKLVTPQLQNCIDNVSRGVKKLIAVGT